jgi:hypothetical protein
VPPNRELLIEDYAPHTAETQAAWEIQNGQLTIAESALAWEFCYARLQHRPLDPNLDATPYNREQHKEQKPLAYAVFANPCNTQQPLIAHS